MTRWRGARKTVLKHEYECASQRAGWRPGYWNNMCKGPEEGRSTELRRTRTAEGAAETGEMGRGQVPESFLEQMAESRF